MKLKYYLIAGLVSALLALGGVVYAQAGGYDLSWWTIDGGGGQISAGSYTLAGAVGQADASSALTAGGYVLDSGFWVGDGSCSNKLYTPIILRRQ